MARYDVNSNYVTHIHALVGKTGIAAPTLSFYLVKGDNAQEAIRNIGRAAKDASLVYTEHPPFGVEVELERYPEQQIKDLETLFRHMPTEMVPVEIAKEIIQETQSALHHKPAKRKAVPITLSKDDANNLRKHFIDESTLQSFIVNYMDRAVTDPAGNDDLSGAPSLAKIFEVAIRGMSTFREIRVNVADEKAFLSPDPVIEAIKTWSQMHGRDEIKAKLELPLARAALKGINLRSRYDLFATAHYQAFDEQEPGDLTHRQLHVVRGNMHALLDKMGDADGLAESFHTLEHIIRNYNAEHAEEIDLPLGFLGEDILDRMSFVAKKTPSRSNLSRQLLTGETRPVEFGRLVLEEMDTSQSHAADADIAGSSHGDDKRANNLQTGGRAMSSSTPTKPTTLPPNGE